METDILGLLYEHPHYAYRPEEIIERRNMHNWDDLEYSPINDVLKTLEDKNLVRKTIKEVYDKSSRKIYSITEKVNLFLVLD